MTVMIMMMMMTEEVNDDSVNTRDDSCGNSVLAVMVTVGTVIDE